MNKKFYITTAIAYASSKPHIGNVYEIILADAIARYKRLTGFDVYFQTGTDEHGLKIEQKAKEHNMVPQDYVDGLSNEIKNIWDLMNISYDQFVRTTNKEHERKVKQIFKHLYDQGDIYMKSYEGLYCTACESFFTETQLNNGHCPDCGNEVHATSEESYFFKLSNYTDRLIKYIDEHPDFIQPELRKNEMINNFLKPGLQDLCVSRTSFTWGIPVDFDPKHVIYVWIDALTNYITFLGYEPDGQNKPEFDKYWPADVHLIGKDILRFHTLYWPIVLMALDLPLPHKIFGHPWMLFGTDKMSKSKGNIIYADDLVKLYGVDAVRYYALHEIPFAQDGTITTDLLVERINSDLANTLGNLVNRTISMVNKYFDGIIPTNGLTEPIDDTLINYVMDSVKTVDSKMTDLKIADALDEIFNIYRRCNKYIDETTPWALSKDEIKQARLATVLYNLLETIRIGTVLLQAFLPETAQAIFQQLNTTNYAYDSISKFGQLKSGNHLGKIAILFNRIEKD